MAKRSYVDEIIAKHSRLLKRANRHDQFTRRVKHVVAGFRFLQTLDNNVPFRSEMMKYCPIGYIACVEGYIRLLVAELIDAGAPYRDNITQLKDIKFTSETVLAIHERQVTLGQFVAHLLPVNNVSDINRSLSTIIGHDFLDELTSQPTSPMNPKPLGDVSPKMIAETEQFFQLRHLYAHELATKERVSVRAIERCMGSTAIFVVMTEVLAGQEWFSSS